MEKILINLDSRHRDINLYPTSSFFRIGSDDQNNSNYSNYLNFKNIDYIKLVSAEIPNNFYVFTDSRFNNFFNITCILNEGETKNPYIDMGEVSITLPTGTFDADVLCNAINIILKNNFLSVGVINNKGIITITDGLKFSVNMVINKFTIENMSTNYTFEINFNNSNIDYRSFGYMIGYKENIINFPPLFSYTATSCTDIIGERYIFIRINNFGLTYINHKNPKKVLAKIILDKYKEDFIYSNNQDQINKEHKFRLPVNINRLEIELLDYNGNRLDNNGLDFSITIEFGQIYDEKLYNKSFDYIKMREKQSEELSLDIINNNETVISSDNTQHKMLDNIFEKIKPEIIPVPEIINLEDKRQKNIKKKKKKINFNY